MKGRENIWLPYTQMQIVPEQLHVVSANGVKIKLQDGRELIDGIASWWSAAHGYNHPHIISALKKQSETLPHVMLAGLANGPAYSLANKLANVTPQGLNKVFFSDSGSTAVEVAIKIALQFFINQKIKNKSDHACASRAPEKQGFSEYQFSSFDENQYKNKFISFQNSYHGDTTGAMSLSDLENGMHKKFTNFLPRNFNFKLPGNDQELNQFENEVKKIKDQVAAVIMEPLVQCAGGMKFHSPEILKSIYQITKKYNLLFIADECATGFFRTGKYFAVNHADICPDIMVLGKALTGGVMTLAATIVTDEIYNQFLSDDLDYALMHGPTFMGNALACAVANASLELFETINYQEKVFDIEKILIREFKKFEKLKIVKDLRIKGAIGVIETGGTYKEMIKLRSELVKKSIWLRPFAGVIYLMPPLIIGEGDLIKIIDAVYELLLES